MRIRTESAATRRSPAGALGVAVLAAAMLAAGAASAQTQRSGGGGASNQIMQQYQQLASERTALQADNAKLKSDVDALTKERDALKKERDALKARSGGSEAAASKAAVAAAAAAEQTAATQRRKLDELIAKYRETATALQDSERDRAELRNQTERTKQQYGECVAKNGKLKDLTEEVLNRYEHMGSFSKATIDEPFTKLTRTRVQNLADEVRDQAGDLTVRPVAPATP